jgi:hypothetical protein
MGSTISRRIIVQAYLGIKWEPIAKKNKAKMSGRMAEMANCLPSRHKVLSSTPCTTKKKKKKVHALHKNDNRFHCLLYKNLNFFRIKAIHNSTPICFPSLISNTLKSLYTLFPIPCNPLFCHWTPITPNSQPLWTLKKPTGLHRKFTNKFWF